ncbi:MAG: glycoside hydrolase family 28 protein [Lachnospira sp.]|nr:glycoside hydrolase family 28 protein [Lachnospira sp.]
MKASDFVIKVPEFPERSVCITDFGASVSEGTMEDGSFNAEAINKAIDTVSNLGGGKVIVPAGIWITGPIRLKSNVNLHLEKQATIKFSKNKKEYPLIITNYEGQQAIRTVSPITAHKASNIGITGYGYIDGSGELWRPVKQFKVTDKQWQAMLKKSPYVLATKEHGVWFPTESAYVGNEKNIQGNDDSVLSMAAPYYDFYRPVMVSLRYCTNVLLEGVTFMNSPAWNIHPFFCENLTVRNISVSNPYYAQNGDGIDIESCKNVHVHDNVFETGDDAICIKSGKNAEARTFEGPCENLYIHDCLVNEGHGGFVIGSEMSRGVKNILVENCTFIGTDVGIRMKSAMGRGGVVENIEINDINMVNIKNEAIILTMGYVLNLLNRNEEIKKDNEEDVPYFKDIRMNRIHCTGADVAVKIEPITGRPDTISDIVIANSDFKATKDNVVDGENIQIVNSMFA